MILFLLSPCCDRILLPSGPVLVFTLPHPSSNLVSMSRSIQQVKSFEQAMVVGSGGVGCGWLWCGGWWWWVVAVGDGGGWWVDGSVVVNK